MRILLTTRVVRCCKFGSYRYIAFHVPKDPTVEEAKAKVNTFSTMVMTASKVTSLVLPAKHPAPPGSELKECLLSRRSTEPRKVVSKEERKFSQSYQKYLSKSRKNDSKDNSDDGAACPTGASECIQECQRRTNRKRFEALEASEKDKVMQIMYLLDHFSGSDKLYHEMASSLREMPRSYLVSAYRKLLMSQSRREICREISIECRSSKCCKRTFVGRMDAQGVENPESQKIQSKNLWGWRQIFTNKQLHVVLICLAGR